MVMRIDIDMRNAHLFIFGEVKEFVVILEALKQVGTSSKRPVYLRM